MVIFWKILLSIYWQKWWTKDSETKRQKDKKADTLKDNETKRQTKEIIDYSVSQCPFLNLKTQRHKMDTELDNMILKIDKNMASLMKVNCMIASGWFELSGHRGRCGVTSGLVKWVKCQHKIFDWLNATDSELPLVQSLVMCLDDTFIDCGTHGKYCMWKLLVTSYNYHLTWYLHNHFLNSILNSYLYELIEKSRLQLT